jgi:hypothetical protein
LTQSNTLLRHSLHPKNVAYALGNMVIQSVCPIEREGNILKHCAQ